MYPLIGITCGEEGLNFYLRQFYVQAIEGLGGVPLILPILKRNDLRGSYLTLIDGLVLSGGVDVNPLLFGEEPLIGMGEITLLRDEFEIGLVQKFYPLEKPILGICRGCQVLNLALGGSVFQDIFSQIPGVLKHEQRAPRELSTHSIQLIPETKLGKIILRDKWQVNSFHHQAVKEPAADFLAVAHALDGVIEGIEGRSHPFALGVQWHPECNWQIDQVSYSIFEAFLSACHKN